MEDATAVVLMVTTTAIEINRNNIDRIAGKSSFPAISIIYGKYQIIVCGEARNKALKEFRCQEK